jgi:hypothetical protein
MRKQDRPPIANPFVKVNLALRCLSGKIRRFVVDA